MPHPVVLVTATNLQDNKRSYNFTEAVVIGGYVFRLREVAIIRLCVSKV
jgi:hypothetical protein